MKYLAAIAMTILVTSSSAQAGWCEKARADYASDMAKDKAADTSQWAPGAKEANDAFNRRTRENIDKGCAPGGFYDQLDEAEREIKAQCEAHPDTKGCQKAGIAPATRARHRSAARSSNQGGYNFYNPSRSRG